MNTGRKIPSTGLTTPVNGMNLIVHDWKDNKNSSPRTVLLKKNNHVNFGIQILFLFSIVCDRKTHTNINK